MVSHRSILPHRPRPCWATRAGRPYRLRRSPALSPSTGTAPLLPLRSRRTRSPESGGQYDGGHGRVNNDLDSANDTYTFTLVAGAGDDDNATFTLSGTTLAANESFNYEVKKDYTVRIEVNDGKGGIFAQAVAITVVDVNETPTVLAPDNNSVIDKFRAALRWLPMLTVTDPDNADAYSIADTFTMAIAGADAGYFRSAACRSKAKAAGLETAEKQAQEDLQNSDHR